jgi:hypothetical protein
MVFPLPAGAKAEPKAVAKAVHIDRADISTMTTMQKVVVIQLPQI